MTAVEGVSEPADDQYRDFRRKTFGAASGVFEDERKNHWAGWQHQAASVLESQATDLIMGFFITVNSVLVVLETNFKAEDKDMPVWLNVCTTALIIIYTVELCARIALYQRFFFHNAWNLFDLFVVGTDIISEVIGRLFEDVMPSVSVLRIFRILRLLRFVEFLTVFSELNMMIRLMFSSLRTMFWGTVLLIVTVTLWSIIAVEFLHPLNKDLAKDGLFDGCDRCVRAYESVYQANLTFFQHLVFGDSWGQINCVLIEHHPWTSVVLVSAGITIDLILLNLILTVIVDKAHEQHEQDAQRALRRKEVMFERAKQKLIEICASIDGDGSGELELEELVHGFETNKEFALTLSLMDIKLEDMSVVFSILDEDNSGAVTYTEFVDQLYKMKSQDSQTMLLFIKGYVNELRGKVGEQLSMMRTKITHRLDEIAEYMKTMSGGPNLEVVSDPKVVNDGSGGNPPPTRQISPGLQILSSDVFQKDLEICTTKLHNVAEKIESQMTQNLQQLQASLGFLYELEGARQPSPFFQSCSVVNGRSRPTALTPLPPSRTPATSIGTPAQPQSFNQSFNDASTNGFRGQ